MGVTYKLREEVIHFIIGRRQSNPLASCRQLAESASQEFGLHLSKSSVHDVLRQAGIITPRGRKPNLKFEIPQEKKKQIQASLSQVKLLPDPLETPNAKELSFPNASVGNPEIAQTLDPRPSTKTFEGRLQHSGVTNNYEHSGMTQDQTISPEYEGAGKIFLKAALWDLGIFSEENIKAGDGNYYLTHSKGIKVALENNKSFFIDSPLPLERCIRETVDGLVNNVKPFIVDKVSDEGLFKASMVPEAGFKINSISIVDYKDHILFEFNNLVEFKRTFIFKNRIFMESNEINLNERSKAIFFPQLIDNNEVIDNILNLKGFDTTNKDENIVTLLIYDSYGNKAILQEAAEKLNGMYLRDEQGRLVSVKIRG